MTAFERPATLQTRDSSNEISRDWEGGDRQARPAQNTPASQVPSDRGDAKSGLGVHPRRGGEPTAGLKTLLRRCVRFFSPCLNSKSDKHDPNIGGGIRQRPATFSFGANPPDEEATGVEVDGKRVSSGSRWAASGTLDINSSSKRREALVFHRGGRQFLFILFFTSLTINVELVFVFVCIALTADRYLLNFSRFPLLLRNQIK